MSTCQENDCDAQVVARGYCGKCYMRAKRRGDLQTDPLQAHAPLEERLWRNVKKIDTCWLWQGAVNRRGYGSIQTAGKGSKRVATHRLSYQLAYGDIPDGLFVCHKCDVPNCVNPEHLWLGTHEQNMEDMRRKGRASREAVKGTQNGKSLLTEDQVRYIRASKLGHAALGRQLGVSPNCIRGVRTGRTWSHVK